MNIKNYLQEIFFKLWHLTQRFGVHEAIVVIFAFLIYFFIRGAVVDRAGEAFVNATDIINVEKNLGFYWELQMQSWILDSFWMIKAMNWIYFWGHMPLVVIAAIYLWIWHRTSYGLIRNAFLISGAIGVLIYATYPVSPPRLIPFAGFIDTMAAFDRLGYNAQETQAFFNPFAAVPSLHFGWSMLIGAVVAWVGRKHRLLLILGIIWPIAMFFAVVLTGNHFILDAIAGALVCVIGILLALCLYWARLYFVRLFFSLWRSRRGRTVT